MKTPDELIRFISDHLEFYRNYNPESFKSWVIWNQAMGYVMEILNDDDSLAGLVIARPVMEAEDAYDHYAFDPEGSCIFVELLIGTKPLCKHAAVFLVIERFGVRDKVAWRRNPHGEIREYSSKSVRRNIFRREKINVS